MVAQRLFSPPSSGERIGSKEGVTPSSARRNAASLIRGTALQRLLGPRWRISNLSDWRSDEPFGVCVAVGGLPEKDSSLYGGGILLGQTTSACVHPSFRQVFRPHFDLSLMWYMAISSFLSRKPLAFRVKKQGTSLRAAWPHQITQQPRGFGQSRFSLAA